MLHEISILLKRRQKKRRTNMGMRMCERKRFTPHFNTFENASHRNVSSFSVHWFHICPYWTRNKTKRIELNTTRIHHMKSKSCKQRGKMNVCNSLFNFIEFLLFLLLLITSYGFHRDFSSSCTHTIRYVIFRFSGWGSRIVMTQKAYAKIEYGDCWVNAAKTWWKHQ